MKNVIWYEVVQREKSTEKPYQQGVIVQLTRESNGFALWLVTNFGEDGEAKLLWFDRFSLESVVITKAVLGVCGPSPIPEIKAACSEWFLKNEE